MGRKKRTSAVDQKRSQYILAGALLALTLIGIIIFLLYVSNKSNSETTITTTVISEPVPEIEIIEEPEQKLFDAVAIQETVDEWVSSNGGESAVVVSDVEGKVLAVHNESEEFFAASIYKLYVAYAGYQQVDDGSVDPTEIYINGNTRAECLDLMIRDSDSPCAEKLWNELGKEELTAQLEEYGILNTSMVNITTTAEDAALILGRIESGEGLSEASRLAYLDSMKTQDALYRRGLPSGFSDSVVVYNKVGWNEQKEWHDTAIVEFADSRKLIVSVFTDEVGFSTVAALGPAIEQTVE